MKRYLGNANEMETIHVTMYLYPEIHACFESVMSSVSLDENAHRYHTDLNPSRIINGPLSSYGEELEPPIKEEYESFIEDCKWLVEELGFTIIKTSRSTDSEKSEYILIFGMKGKPCGRLIYDLRISDHPLDATFPEEWKDYALEYLKMQHVLDDSASKAGINFIVEKVTVGSVTDDTWDKAFQRLYHVLAKIRRKVRVWLSSHKL